MNIKRAEQPNDTQHTSTNTQITQNNWNYLQKAQTSQQISQHQTNSQQSHNNSKIKQKTSSTQLKHSQHNSNKSHRRLKQTIKLQNNSNNSNTRDTTNKWNNLTPNQNIYPTDLKTCQTTQTTLKKKKNATHYNSNKLTPTRTTHNLN